MISLLHLTNWYTPSSHWRFDRFVGDVQHQLVMSTFRAFLLTSN